MIQNRVLTTDDYVAMFKRHLKMIVALALVAPLLGFIISYAFAAKYTSQSLVLVEGQKVPQGYVAPVVTEDLSARVATLGQKALGADRLRPLIERLNQQGILHSGNADELMDEIRSGVSIEAVQSVVVPSPNQGAGRPGRPGQAEVPGFNVEYTASNPREAQAICAGLTDIMLQENLKDREQVAQSTTDFLTRQVDDAKHNLDDLDARLATFKKQYMGQLPGDEDTNLKLLAGLNSQLDASTQALNRAQQDKAFTESLLAEQVAAWKSSQSATNPQSLQQQLSSEKAKLIDLQNRYTDDYPDVIKEKAEVADLQKQLNQINSAAANASTATTAKASADEPPEIQQLRVQIHQSEATIAQATREQKNLQNEIKTVQGRIALSPAVEEQYKKLTRDYDTAQKFYDDLLADKSKSEMQTAMERDQEGEQMRLQIPADLPDSPSFPNRLMFAGGGLGTGLVLGIGLTLLLELRDKSLRTEDDVLAVLQLPVLSQVPWIGAELQPQNGNGKSRGKFNFKSRTMSDATKVEV